MGHRHEVHSQAPSPIHQLQRDTSTGNAKEVLQTLFPGFLDDQF